MVASHAALVRAPDLAPPAGPHCGGDDRSPAGLGTGGKARLAVELAADLVRRSNPETVVITDALGRVGACAQIRIGEACVWAMETGTDLLRLNSPLPHAPGRPCKKWRLQSTRSWPAGG